MRKRARSPGEPSPETTNPLILLAAAEELRVTPDEIQIRLSEDGPSLPYTLKTEWSPEWVSNMLEKGEDFIVLEGLDSPEMEGKCQGNDIVAALRYLHDGPSESLNDGGEGSSDVLDLLVVLFAVLRGTDYMQIREELYCNLATKAKEVLIPALPTMPHHTTSIPVRLQLLSVTAGQRLFDWLGTDAVLQLVRRNTVAVNHLGRMRFEEDSEVAATDEDLKLLVAEGGSSVVELVYPPPCPEATLALFGESLQVLVLGTRDVGFTGHKLAHLPNLTKLNVAEMKSIRTLGPHANKLRSLHVGETSLGDIELATATSLVELHARECRGLTTVRPFAATLEVLGASRTKLTNSGLSEATNLTWLDVSRCRGLTSVNACASKLRTLYASGSGINDEGIRGAAHLERLDVSRCVGVTTVAPFASTLTHLDAGRSGLTDEGLRLATNLTSLDVAYCEHLTDAALKYNRKLKVLRIKKCTSVTTVESCGATLRELRATATGLTDSGLRNATKLELLVVDNCRDVTTVEPCAQTLLKLSADYSGIDDDGLKNASQLQFLSVKGCSGVTTVAPFRQTLGELRRQDSGISIEELCLSGERDIPVVDLSESEDLDLMLQRARQLLQKVNDIDVTDLTQGEHGDLMLQRRDQLLQSVSDIIEDLKSELAEL